jgi:hypothetical protein
MLKALIITMFISTFLSANELKNVISNIPENDLQEIKLLFKDLFNTQGFSYSLYGDKPLSFSDYSLSSYTSTELLKVLPLDKCCESILEIYSEPSGFLKKRWKIWQKYKHLFKIKNYLLIEKQYLNQNRIFFINKKYLIKMLDKHIKYFNRIMKVETNSEALFKEIAMEGKDIFEITHNNEGILGILLGFGKYNAMLFQERKALIHSLKMPLKNFNTIKWNLEKINKKLQLLHEHDSYIIASINRVGFVADSNHPETIQLRIKYDELNKKINEIYSRDDWFEQTLIQLTSD